MNSSESKVENNSELPRKRRQCFHVSSLIATIPVVIGFVLLAVPGHHQQINWSIIESWSYGWPAIHAVRIPDGKAAAAMLEQDKVNWPRPRARFHSKRKFWSDLKNWHYSTEESKWTWNKQALAINVSVGFLAIGLTLFLFEFRRRARRSFFQIRLSDVFVFISILAIGFAFAGNSIADARKSFASARSLEQRDNFILKRGVNEPPVWLDRLTDFRFSFTTIIEGEASPIYQQYKCASIGMSRAPELPALKPALNNVAKTAMELNQLCVQKLRIHSLDESLAELLAKISPHSIKELGIWNPKPESANFSLGRFKNLKQLSLASSDLPELQFDFPALPKLTHLELHYNSNQLKEPMISWIRSQPNLESLQVRRFNGARSRQQYSKVKELFPDLVD